MKNKVKGLAGKPTQTFWQKKGCFHGFFYELSSPYLQHLSTLKLFIIMPFHTRFDLQSIVASVKSRKSPKQFGLQIGSWDKFTLETFGNLRIKHFAALLKILPNEARQQLIYLQQVWSAKISPKDAKEMITDYTKNHKKQGDPSYFKIKKQDVVDYISNYKDPDYRLTFKFGCTDANSGLSIFLHVMGVNGKSDAPDYIECLINSSTATEVTPQQFSPTDVFSTKTGNYFKTRAGNDQYKKGIAHHIIKSPGIELGLTDFLDEKINPNSMGKNTLYIFPAYGSVKQNNSSYRDQNTLVLSFFSDVEVASLTNNTAESDLLYDLGGACCPPQ